PTAGAWHATKFLDPAGDGAVLPIVHLNGFKISSPSIFGTVTDEELAEMFSGHGWDCALVEGDDLDASMYGALDWAYARIRGIQRAFRGGAGLERPRWPVLVVRSPKGWTGIKEVDGKAVEGSFRSHQVPVSDARTNPAHLKLLEEWFRSYKPQELFDDGRP